MKENLLPLWKKIVFSLLIFLVVAALLYFPAEVIFRIAHRIPLFSDQLNSDDRGVLADDDTTAMDFNSVHYYEIFRKSDNPVLFYEPIPGFSKGAVQINAHGFRDREYDLAKPRDTTRIVVLGDSVIWGHGIVLADTFAKQLEDLLNDRLDGKYEVLNFGVSGYSLQQEVEQYIDRASRFQPDIAILGLCINDSLYSSEEGDFFTAQNGGLFSKSYLLDSLGVKIDQVLHQYFGVPQSYLEHIVDVPAQMNRLKQASEGVPWLVLMFPRLDDLGNYRSLPEHTILTQPARNLGFSVRDLLADYRKYSSESISIDPIHPNRRGNTIAAEAAYDALLQNGMIRFKPENHVLK
ncbi:MAG: SGNH/GDSL hydrolase family protein [Pirellulales bacterium]|nr:SGNH/GDSL hydrolase family protein [Pirellulales bacterium]